MKRLLWRLLDAWLFRPDEHPGGGYKNTERDIDRAARRRY